VSLPDPPLLLITDRTQAVRPLKEIVSSAFDGGCRWVMLREKDLSSAGRIALLGDLRDLAAPYGATVIVNGDIDAALAAGVAGVHLPQNHAGIGSARQMLGDDALIGVSAHNLEEAQAATDADYITLSPVFISPSKPEYGPALTPNGFEKIARQVPLPVLGLGGIETDKASELASAGASGIAVMGSVMRAENPAREVEMLLRAWTS